MTQPDLILKLVEMLLSERDKNNNLQSQLEEQKKVCVIAVHIHKQYTQPDREYIV